MPTFGGIIVAAAALMLPSLVPGLSSGLQFFAPGIAACFLEQSQDIRQKLFAASGVFILGSLILLFLGIPEGVLVLAQSVCIAVILVVYSWAGRTSPEALAACSLCLVVLSATVILLATGGKPMAAYHAMVEELSKEFDRGVEIYKQNAGDQVTSQIDTIMGQIKETMISFFPGILGSLFIFLSLVNIYVCNMCSKIRYNRELIGPEFDQWRMPPWLIWAFIVSGFMAIYPGEQISAAGKNIVTAVSIFYLIQGFAVMKFFFNTMKTPAFVRWLVYLLIGIQWYGLLMVVFTGLMDNWFDFRNRLEKNRKNKDSE